MTTVTYHAIKWGVVGLMAIVGGMASAVLAMMVMNMIPQIPGLNGS
jgi:hypothetical protein